MLEYDEWFEKFGFDLDDENSFDAYDNYVADYQDAKYHEWKDNR